MTRCIAHGSSFYAQRGSHFFKPVKKENAESNLRKTAYKFHNNVCPCHGFGDHNISQYPAQKLKEVTQYLEHKQAFHFSKGISKKNMNNNVSTGI